MLSYVIVQLCSNGAVEAAAAILAICSPAASVRYTEKLRNRNKTKNKKKHIINTTVFKSDMC